MPDTITALDTASTDQLIAALVARHRATLGQTCGQLEDLDTILSVAAGVAQSLERRVCEALNSEVGRFISEHAVCKAASGDEFAAVIMRALKLPQPGKRQPPPPFGSGPFR